MFQGCGRWRRCRERAWQPRLAQREAPGGGDSEELDAVFESVALPEPRGWPRVLILTLIFTRTLLVGC